MSILRELSATGGVITEAELATLLAKLRQERGGSEHTYYYVRDIKNIDLKGNWGDLLLASTRPKQDRAKKTSMFDHVERIYREFDDEIKFFRAKYFDPTVPPRVPVVEIPFEMRANILRHIRDEMYQGAGAKHMPTLEDGETVYQNHLSPGQLGMLVDDMTTETRRPWLYVAKNGRRYLLRHELMDSYLFEKVNQPVPEYKHDKTFFAVWQELDPVESNQWQLCGIIRRKS